MVLMIAFSGSLLIILGANSQISNDLTEPQDPTTDVKGNIESKMENLKKTAALIINPIIIAFGLVALRSMRKLHESTV